jgi:hypothetical protein
MPIVQKIIITDDDEIRPAKIEKIEKIEKAERGGVSVASKEANALLLASALAHLAAENSPPRGLNEPMDDPWENDTFANIQQSVNLLLSEPGGPVEGRERDDESKENAQRSIDAERRSDKPVDKKIETVMKTHAPVVEEKEEKDEIGEATEQATQKRRRDDMEGMALDRSERNETEPAALQANDSRHVRMKTHSETEEVVNRERELGSARMAMAHRDAMQTEREERERSARAIEMQADMERQTMLRQMADERALREQEEGREREAMREEERKPRERNVQSMMQILATKPAREGACKFGFCLFVFNANFFRTSPPVLTSRAACRAVPHAGRGPSWANGLLLHEVETRSLSFFSPVMFPLLSRNDLLQDVRALCSIGAPSQLVNERTLGNESIQSQLQRMVAIELTHLPILFF